MASVSDLPIGYIQEGVSLKVMNSGNVLADTNLSVISETDWKDMEAQWLDSSIDFDRATAQLPHIKYYRIVPD